jgi:BNR repeat-like domain
MPNCPPERHRAHGCSRRPTTGRAILSKYKVGQSPNDQGSILPGVRISAGRPPRRTDISHRPELRDSAQMLSPLALAPSLYLELRRARCLGPDASREVDRMAFVLRATSWMPVLRRACAWLLASAAGLAVLGLPAATARGATDPVAAPDNGSGAFRGSELTQVSFDPFTNPDSQHRTEVEPGSFSNGRQVVAAFQQGRSFSGGASDIGFATSILGGRAWIHGVLPGTTTSVGGPYARLSDASVAYDAAHRVWLISSLAITAQDLPIAVIANRSPNGLQWSAPQTVAAVAPGELFDKNWTVCDNTRSSRFFGHCYTEFDDGVTGLIKMSTSTDGGQTWSAPLETAAHDLGFAGEPVVQPNGTVVVPIDDFNETRILTFRSTDGGASWSAAVTVSPITQHFTAVTTLRTSALLSAAIDAAGRVYVVWQDCRFRAGCTSNDMVVSTSNDGINWSPVRRVPIDPVDSGADHFIPGLAVDPHSSGSRARLALAYYYYPSATCTTATCQLDVGFIQSPDGGVHWGTPTQLAGPMNLGWLPNTSQGVMVGDYISTSFLGGDPKPFFAVAKPPSGGLLNEATYTTANEHRRLDARLLHVAELALGPPAPHPAPRPIVPARAQ